MLVPLVYQAIGCRLSRDWDFPRRLGYSTVQTRLTTDPNHTTGLYDFLKLPLTALDAAYPTSMFVKWENSLEQFQLHEKPGNQVGLPRNAVYHCKPQFVSISLFLSKHPTLFLYLSKLATHTHIYIYDMLETWWNHVECWNPQNIMVKSPFLLGSITNCQAQI